MQSSWDIQPIFGLSASELWDPMGRKFWANLPPYPWAREIVQLLEDHFGTERICILTSPIRTDGCVDGKMDWIRKHFPQFRRRFLVGPAKEFCAGPRHVLVDDHSVNIENFANAGGHTFLFPAPWNSRFQEYQVPALKRWLDALKVLG